MIVPVRVEGAAAREWCLVELQGELIPNDGASMADVSIGSLWYENGVPMMRIGNHIVAGKVAKLPKPFAVLERLATETAAAGDVDMENPATAASSTESDSGFDVVGIARTRVIFSSRPKPVLT